LLLKAQKRNKDVRVYDTVNLVQKKQQRKEGIENFNEKAIFNIIGNTYNDQSSSMNYRCSFNPIDRLVEAYEENKKLYERLIKVEQEKTAYLERLVDKK